MSRSKETGFKYSDAYHSFFEGYSEVKEPGTNKIKRVYTAEYYRADITDRQYVLVKTAYPLLLILACFCLIFPLLISNSISKASISPIFQCLCIVLIVINAVKIFMYDTAARNLTVGEYYQNSVRIKLYLLIGAGCFAALFICYAVYFFSNIKSISVSDILIWLASLLGAFCLLAIWWIEKHLNYIAIDNTNEKPEDSIEIWR